MANIGWNADLAWGSNDWGDLANVTVTPTGQSLATTTGNNDVQIDVAPIPTGLQLNLSLNSVQAFGLALVPVTGEGLTVSEGNIDPAPDAIVTGSQLNINQGSVTVEDDIRSGWGRLTWGENDWGRAGLSVIGEATGLQLNVSLGTAVLDANTLIDLTGEGLTVAEGTVDPSPDATVTGIGMTVGVGLGTVTANADLEITGEQLNLGLGTVIADAVTFAEVNGQQLNLSLNSAVAGASAEVDLTGIGLTLSIQDINVQAWQIVDTGTSVNWNDIDTAA